MTNITPWSVTEDVNYDKLITEFGSEYISSELLIRMEYLTNQPIHKWLKRGLFFSHRNLNSIMDCYEKHEPMYLYTGRGPSSESMHIGHLIPFIFTKYLQDVFDAPLVIQMTDDEKFLWKDLTMDEIDVYTKENIKDIISIGLNSNKTFIFSNKQYISELYPTILQIQKRVTCSTSKAIFGFDNETNIGQMNFPAIQAAPAFPSSFSKLLPITSKCLIPCAIDQDPFFRLTRDIAPKIGFAKPSLIHSKFIPSLKGPGKMSASDINSCIYLTDDIPTIRKKIMKSFSGGGETKALHELYGANLNIDVPFQLLNIFMDDDNRLDFIRENYSKGRMSTSQVKNELCDCLIPIVLNHQTTRSQITNDTIHEFMHIRSL